MTQSWTYNPDRTVDTHTDFRGNAWQSLWSSCCTSRLVAQTDPLGAATTMAHDAHGNVTRSEKVHGMTVFNQQTTRFDARHRPIAPITWRARLAVAWRAGYNGFCRFAVAPQEEQGPVRMPTISMFHGIIIRMYYAPSEHNPPHFHAYYNEFKATFSIESLDLMEGDLPRRQLRLVQAWAELYQDELRADWQLAMNGEEPFRIQPLQ